MIASIQHNDHEGIGAILEMIERKAPLYMRVGGGSSSREYAPRKKQTYMTKEQEDRATQMLIEGKHTRFAIARIIGVGPRSVYNLAKRIGVAVRDGRIER